jgi:hypothetical protein
VTPHDAAVVDTNVIAALKLYDPAELPGTLLLTAVSRLPARSGAGLA